MRFELLLVDGGYFIRKAASGDRRSRSLRFGNGLIGRSAGDTISSSDSSETEECEMRGPGSARLISRRAMQINNCATIALSVASHTKAQCRKTRLSAGQAGCMYGSMESVRWSMTARRMFLPIKEADMALGDRLARSPDVAATVADSKA
jgi:hypothetical protein